MYTKAGERDFGRLGGLTLNVGWTRAICRNILSCTCYRKAIISSCFWITFICNNICFRLSYLQRKAPMLGKEIRHKLFDDKSKPRPMKPRKR